MFVLAFFNQAGTPKIGLSPTVNIRRVSDGTLVVNGAIMTELGDGFYQYDFTAFVTGTEYAILCDSVTLTGSERYVYSGSDALNAQDVRDAMKLSPSAGTPATDSIDIQVNEIWELAGLDITNPMTVTPTSRITGTINLALTGDGTTTTTVTRLP